MNIPAVLFFIFLVLKLTGSIDWSWWWITSPLWGCYVLWIVDGLIDMVITNRSKPKTN